MSQEQLLASLDEEWERGSLPRGFHVGHTGGMRELSDEELLQEACKGLERTPFYTEETRNEILTWIRKRSLEVEPPKRTHQHECRPHRGKTLTHEEAVRRGSLGGRPPSTHCKRGHRLAGANLRWRKRGHRMDRECRTCHNERGRKRGYSRH